MESWRNIEIDKVVLKTKLKDPTKEPDKHFYYVDVSSVSNTLFKIEEPNYLTGKEAPSRARKLIQSEDILFATVRPTLKRIAFIPNELDGQICSTGYCVLKADKTQVDPLFLYFSMLPDYFMERIEKLQRGASYPAIRDSDLKSQKILLPPLLEQRKIAYVLSTVQKALEQQGKLIQHTTELKKALMQKLFTEGTKDEKQKQTEIGLVPESWEVVKLGNAVKIKGGFAFKSEEGIPDSNTQLVRMGNLYQNKLDLKRAPIFYPDNYPKEFSNYVLSEGDLIMSLTGTMGKEDYGFTVKVPKTNKTLLLNQRIAKFEIIDDTINKDYLKQYFLSRVFLNRLYKTAKGTKQANLSSNEMKSLFLLKPQPKEQIEISNTLGLLECKIEIYEQKKQTLSNLFKTLLHELMTGERRVNEIEFKALNKEYKIKEMPLRMAAED